MVSLQLHHDGYNALALLMEQMLLASKKVQPSDCLTQLLNVCKAVSFADKELILDETVAMSEEEQTQDSPQKSPRKETPEPQSKNNSPITAEMMNGKSETQSPTSTTTIFSASSLLESAQTSPPAPTAITPPTSTKDPLADTLTNHPLSQIFPNKDVLSQILPNSEALIAAANAKSTTPILPTPNLLLPNSSPLMIPTSTPTLSTPTPLLPTSTPLRSLSTPILPTSTRFNPTILTHPYSFPLGRSGSLPFFPNLNLKSPDSFKQEEKDAGLLDHQLLSGRLQDVVKAFAANNATFPLPTSICNNWQNNLISQVQTGSGRQHKMKHCPVCNKVLVASSLYLHMKIHTGEKNYICEFCCKRFLLKHHLHSHLKICQSRTLVLNKKETSQA
ncbi:hypothetical protein ACHWQZ_G002318 [Mnemiopsis leidyi]